MTLRRRAGGSGPTLAGSWCQTGGGQNNLLIQTRKTVSLGVSAPLLLFGMARHVVTT